MECWPWRDISNDPPWQRRVDRGVGMPQGYIRGTGSQITPSVLYMNYSVLQTMAYGLWYQAH